MLVSKGPSLYSYYQGEKIQYQIKVDKCTSSRGLPYNFTILDFQSRELVWGTGTLVKFSGADAPYEIRFADYKDLVIKITRGLDYNKVNIYYKDKVIVVDVNCTKHLLLLGPWKIDLRFRLCHARAFIDTEVGDNLSVPVSVIFILGLLRASTLAS